MANKKKTLLMIAAFMSGACAHGNSGASDVITETEMVKTYACSEEIQGAAAIRQRNQNEFMALRDRYRAATAYQQRWKDTFKKIDRLFKVALSADALEQSEGSVETVIRYNVTYVSGVMHLSLQNNQLFDQGQHKLTDTGKEIVSRIVDVLSRSEDRKIEVASRTTAANEKMERQGETGAAELSIKRAVYLMEYMASQGQNPANLSAAAMGITPEEKTFEKGTTVFRIHPNGREMPRFPDSVK